jgi:hypothetical protein
VFKFGKSKKSAPVVDKDSIKDFIYEKVKDLYNTDKSLYNITRGAKDYIRDTKGVEFMYEYNSLICGVVKQIYDELNHEQ